MLNILDGEVKIASPRPDLVMIWKEYLLKGRKLLDEMIKYIAENTKKHQEEGD